MSSASKIQIKAFDDLFGGSSEENEAVAVQDNSLSADSVKDAVEIPLEELYTFKNHPFKVRDDEKMVEMVESIKQVGILNPAIVRKRVEGGYELISGHTRREAAKRAGLTTMPVIIRDYDDDQATIAMTDSNLQREEIYPSEKAKAYAMKYEAMKHQGVVSGDSGSSLEAMSKETGEGTTTIQRYIVIAKLNDNLLSMIDEKKLGIRQGVDLADLPENEQEQVYRFLTEEKIKPTMTQSAEIKRLSRDGRFSEENVKEILAGKKIMEKPKENNSKEQRKTDTSEDAIYRIFSKTGILAYNEEGDRYGIKKDGKWSDKGLHAGAGLRVFVGGRWIDTAMERNMNREWYLVGTKCVGILENIIVEVPDEDYL